MTLHLVLKHMPVLDPLANSPTLFPLETLEKLPSILETRCAKHFGKKKRRFVPGWFFVSFFYW